MAENRKRYKIRLDEKTLVTVLEHHLYKPRWIKYFGSIEAVEEFIKESNKDEH